MEIKIDIFSGFLGSGKTTLIKKLLEDCYKDEKIALIENEFGEVPIDGELLRENNIEIKEINSGCICCSIEGDFKDTLKVIGEKFKVNRIIIEPSGVAKLSDIIKTCRETDKNFVIDHIFTIIDASNYNMYINNFDNFYKDQIINGKVILLSRIESLSKEELGDIIKDIRKFNKEGAIISTNYEIMEGRDIVKIADRFKEALKNKNSKLVRGDFKRVASRKEVAENVFDSWGLETKRIFTISTLKSIFNKIDSKRDYGYVLRGKGLVRVEGGRWIEFHYIPGEFKLKETYIRDKGKIAIIGEKINKEKLERLFL